MDRDYSSKLSLSRNDRFAALIYILLNETIHLLHIRFVYLSFQGRSGPAGPPGPPVRFMFPFVIPLQNQCCCMNAHHAFDGVFLNLSNMMMTGLQSNSIVTNLYYKM